MKKQPIKRETIKPTVAIAQSGQVLTKLIIVDYGSTLYVGMARKKIIAAANTNVWQAELITLEVLNLAGNVY